MKEGMVLNMNGGETFGDYEKDLGTGSKVQQGDRE